MADRMGEAMKLIEVRAYTKRISGVVNLADPTVFNILNDDEVPVTVEYHRSGWLTVYTVAEVVVSDDA